MKCFKHFREFAQGGCPDCKAEYEASIAALDHCPECNSSDPLKHLSVADVTCIHSWHHGKQPSEPKTPETEACAYCGVEYAIPVSYHHSQDECDAALRHDTL